MRALTIKDGKVLEWGEVGRGKYKVYELEEALPRLYQVRFGNCSIEYSKDPRITSSAWERENVLQPIG
jgi:hypothetical protein